MLITSIHSFVQGKVLGRGYYQKKGPSKMKVGPCSCYHLEGHLLLVMPLTKGLPGSEYKKRDTAVVVERTFSGFVLFMVAEEVDIQV